MTQRERQTPEGGAQMPPRLVAERPAANGAAWLVGKISSRGIPVPRQQELLALAGRQGLLYAHQLGPSLAPPARRPLLPSLLNGQSADLEPCNRPPSSRSTAPWTISSARPSLAPCTRPTSA